MALFSQTSGPKLNQPVVYRTGGTDYAAKITGINSDGTVSIAYFTPGSTTLGAASSVKNDQTAVTLTTSWRWPEEYL